MADSVELTDLEVISRFSLAVRAATADRADVIAALRADLAWLESGRRASSAAKVSAPAKKAAATKSAAKRPAAKKTTRSR